MTTQTAVPPMPTELIESDGHTTSLWHRQHEWYLRYVAPRLPACTLCGGPCDPRLSSHALCDARAARGQPLQRLDSTMPCPCARCERDKPAGGER